MVWPERRLKILASPGAAGLEGFQALLGILGLKHDVEWTGLQEQAEPTKDMEVHKTSWFRVFEEFITTDLIIWPGFLELEHRQRQREALDQGITVMSPLQFLESCWQAEHILAVYPPFACIREKPVIWTILQEAGFAPSLLWYEDESGWQGIQGDGPYWIVPGNWFTQISEQKLFGRPVKQGESSWVIRPDCIDFYETGERLQFRGCMPRWPEPLEEQSACQAVAQALGLGVSWLDIRRALGLEQSTQRWLMHDFGRTQGPDREELSVKQTDDLENRRAG